MHRHDLELIAAFADGSLEDDTVARQRVESCEECRAEFEAQSSAIAALATVSPAAMTDHEKAALHRDLWTELRTGAAVAPAASTSWWYRWSYAAAGLFVVVGLVAVLSQVNGGSGDSGADVANPTSAVAEDGETPLQGADEAPEAFDDAEGDVAEDVTEAAADSFNVLDLMDELREMRFTGRILSGEEETLYDDCLSEARLLDHRVVETHIVDDAEYLAVVSNDAAEDESEDVIYVDATTCLVVGQDG